MRAGTARLSPAVSSSVGRVAHQACEGRRGWRSECAAIRKAPTVNTVRAELVEAHSFSTAAKGKGRASTTPEQVRGRTGWSEEHMTFDSAAETRALFKL